MPNNLLVIGRHPEVVPKVVYSSHREERSDETISATL